MAQRQQAEKKELDGHVTAVASDRRSIWQHWPTGLIAVGVILVSWVGIYLLWRGITSLFGW